MKKRALKWYKKLLTSKGRKKEGYFLVEGIRQVTEIIKSQNFEIEEVLLSEKQSDFLTNLPTIFFTEEQLKSISDANTPSGIIALVRLPKDIESREIPKSSKILFLEDLQDPGNVGTLIRSGVAFNFDGIIMTKESADPFSPKVVRSTGGALGSIWMRRVDNAKEIISKLQKESFELITADIGGGENELFECDKVIFALGNEGNGVSKELHKMSDKIYTIPFESHKIESLNVAIAGSIGMSKLYKRG